mmetsp:Transcript_9869/g.20951  ORF Transcript_9869/g.20951 Transcript_9869/m.20951 type:complete len:509 (-) Transcript_9869:37-1563(-)
MVPGSVRSHLGGGLLLTAVGLLISHHAGGLAAPWAFRGPAALRGALAKQGLGLGAPAPVGSGAALVTKRPPPTAALHAAAVAATEEATLSSVPQSSVNLVKNIVGAGMLSLPAGMAAFSGSPKALEPSLVITLFIGLISAYGFVLIADACHRTGESTYGGAWSRTVSPGTKWLPEMACFAKAGVGCISFSMILGDCISRILHPMGLPAILASRDFVILAITTLVLFPLCMLKSLAPLAKFSVAGVMSNVYIAFFCLLRCFDGSYRPGGAFFRAAPVAPKLVATTGSAWSTVLHPGFTTLLSILATAYLAHYNAPLYYQQLKPGSDGKKAGRFFLVSVLGFAASGAFFGLIMTGGFLTFGANSSGLILNNYAAKDSLAGLARCAICLSLITSYPLVFFSLRKQVLDLIGQRGVDFNAERPALTTALLLGVVTLLALSLHDLGTLAAFAGACFGSFLIYIAPALMVLCAQQRGIGPCPGGWRGRGQRAAQIAMLPLGAVLAVLGAIQSMK